MTSKDLLYKLLNYESRWGLEHQRKSEPAKVRVAQLIALLKAFDLHNRELNDYDAIRHVLFGRFLKEEDSLEEGLKQELYRFSKRVLHIPDDEAPRPLRKHEIKMLYEELMRFRLEVYKLSIDNYIHLEGVNIGLRYSSKLEYELNTVIQEHIVEIDETLCLLMDPQKRQLEGFPPGYPDVDLDQIDRDWIYDNI
jgi:hypothetical protein